ncbi:MAG: DsbA family protein [Ilumatobacteraceae bacterium]
MNIEFWVDPICPFCWVTARWAVDEVQPNREVDITWRPISLFFKNEPAEDSDYFAPVWFTHRMLRVMESVRATEGNDAVFELYWELGTRIHHDKDRDFTAAEALEAVGLDTSHAAAFDDEAWDSVIRAGMDEGLALVGNDVGTPIIAMENSDGVKTGLFGPVISRVPSTEKSVALWDSLVTMMDVDSFFELKRTRTEGPDAGSRPVTA